MSRCGFFCSTVKKCKVLCLALSLAVLFVLGITTQEAHAALNCTTQPTCEDLGYDNDYLSCPFDTSYIKNLSDKELTVPQKSCAEMGFTTDDKSSWCPADKIISCCDSEGDKKGKYTLCAAVSCEKLGYTTGEKTDCTVEELEKCPFDDTYTRCPGTGESQSYTCEELGYSTIDKTAWCKNEDIIKCPSDESYTMCKYPTLCPPSWAKSVGDCGTKGSRGWRLDESRVVVGLPGCHPCMPLSCPAGESTEFPLCGDEEKVYGVSYSGDSLCLGCEPDKKPSLCPSGEYASSDECMAAAKDGETCMQTSFGCWKVTKLEIIPTEVNCDTCQRNGMNYICNNKCSSIGGATCQACLVVDLPETPSCCPAWTGGNITYYDNTGKCWNYRCAGCTACPGHGDDLTPGGDPDGDLTPGGGWGTLNPCEPGPDYDECKCKEYQRPGYCNIIGGHSADPICCGLDEELGSTETGVITKP